MKKRGKSKDKLPEDLDNFKKQAYEDLLKEEKMMKIELMKEINQYNEALDKIKKEYEIEMKNYERQKDRYDEKVSNLEKDILDIRKERIKLEKKLKK